MRKILLLLSGVLLLSAQLLAQTRTISGKITDGQASPIPNVSVIVKGTSVGTTTDESGAYTLNVPNNAKTLVFSAVGMGTQEISIGSRTDVSITLLPAGQSMQEVVVVGYSKTTKEAFTGSAVQVTGSRLNNKAVNNVSQALAGEVAGVRVINTSGQPGSVATVRIRGLGSVNGNRDPLYVVDGVPFTGNLNAINSADIETITVLKDATATAIYGARGANGVVIVTTRTGRGKGFVEVDGRFGVNKSIIPRYDVIRDPEQYIGLAWEGLYNQGDPNGVITDRAQYANQALFSGEYIGSAYNMWKVNNVSELIDPATKQVRPGVQRKYNPENWEDHAFQSSNRSEVNVKLGGGDSKTNYYTSLGYLNDVGYSINTDFKRLTGRLNLTHEVKKWLIGSVNMNYANSKSTNNGQESNSNSVFWFVDNLPSFYPLFLRDEDGNFVPDPIYGGNQYDYGVDGRGFGAFTNSIADAWYNQNRFNKNELSGNASITIKFTDWLSLENRYGVQYYNNQRREFTNKFYGSAASQKGSVYHVGAEMLNLLRFNKHFGDHGLEVLAAHESTDWRLMTEQNFKYNLVSNDQNDLNNALVQTPTAGFTERYKLESYFGQVNYDFNNTYLLSGSFRRDGSSRFVKDKWGNFGSIGAGWVMSNEAFLKNLTWLNYLKVKASYGVMGEQAGIGYYPGFDLFNIDNLNDNPAFSFDSKGNPDLTWETSKMFQAGVEFRIKSFLTGSIDYYVKNTDNLLFDRRVGPSIGYALLKVNDGQLRNQGLEFDLTGHIIQKKDFYIDLSVNGEMMKNKLTKMPIDPVTGKEKPLDVQTRYGYSVGRSIFDFYLREYVGVDAADGRSTWTVYYNDANNNDVLDGGESVGSLTQYLAENPDKAGVLKKTTTKNYATATQFFIGKNAIPKIRGAVNLTAGFKGFDLAVQMLYSLGGYSYDVAYAGLMDNGVAGSNNWHVDILNRWQKAGDVTDVPRLSNDLDQNVVSSSSRFVTKANYWILNNVRLGYTLPKSLAGKLFVDGASIFVSGDNLWLTSERKGFNPATAESGISDTYRYSPLSTLTVGLKVRF
jgi:TonB-linked SusC/RagA family outer membrane protein